MFYCPKNEVLFGLCGYCLKLVGLGGLEPPTSPLSVLRSLQAYGLINRFSEDIDITAFRWLVIRNLELGDRNSRWEKSLELLQAEPEPLKSWRLA
jgi:hypothetical protein